MIQQLAFRIRTWGGNELYGWLLKNEHRAGQCNRAVTKEGGKDSERFQARLVTAFNSRSCCSPGTSAERRSATRHGEHHRNTRRLRRPSRRGFSVRSPFLIATQDFSSISAAILLRFAYSIRHRRRYRRHRRTLEMFAVLAIRMRKIT